MNNSTVIFTSGSTSINLSLILLVNGISLLFGLPTHPYIIYLIITGAGPGIASEISNLNLSVCEIIICFNSLISIIYYSILVSSLASLINFLAGLGITARPLFQCLICVERYLAVVHPVTFLKFKPLRYKVICCTAVWILCLGSCLWCMFSLDSLNYGLFIWFYAVQFLLFLSIQMFCCVAVLGALKQSGPGERGREREEENHMKRRAFHLILITTVSMVVTYLPFTIMGLFYSLIIQNSSELDSVCYILFTLSGFVQPVLYLHRVGKLRCLCS